MTLWALARLPVFSSLSTQSKILRGWGNRTDSQMKLLAPTEHRHVDLALSTYAHVGESKEAGGSPVPQFTSESKLDLLL